MSDVSSRPSRETILLFYKEHEADKFIRHDRYLKRLLRPVYNRLHRKQKISGFAMSFELLRRALVQAGCEVRINDYEFARLHPDHPVGIVGFPLILEDWDLPNPALLGPSLHDHPRLAPNLMRDPRFRKHLVLADWMRDMFTPVYGDACISWFAGIDLDDWPDTRDEPKDFDVLLYDKIRWDRHVFEPHFLAKIRQTLERRGLRVAELRYKFHDHQTYHDLLRRSKSMLFLCEHETQGLAYQEALACNVPILAWDFGIWADPLWKLVGRTPIPASSVPFFSPECGTTFQTPADFDATLTRFLEELPTYRPRRYVEENLSMKRSAEIYRAAYHSLTKVEASQFRVAQE